MRNSGMRLESSKLRHAFEAESQRAPSPREANWQMVAPILGPVDRTMLMLFLCFFFKDIGWV